MLASHHRSVAPLTFLLTSLLLFLSPTAPGQEIRVGPGERFEKIQDAIDSTVDGDVVRVMAGTYREAIDFKGRKITVASAAGAATTTIDATGLVRMAVVTFKAGESDQSVLEGFTLTKGTGSPITTGSAVLGGGGVFIDKATPVIRNCVIRDNSATRGGGIYVQGAGSGGLIENCEITANRSTGVAGLAGGGICINFTGTTTDLVTIRDCTITKNTIPATGAVLGGGAYLGANNIRAKVVMTSCTVEENLLGTTAVSGGHGAGLFLDTVLVEIDGCTITGNQGLHGGGVGIRNVPTGSFIKNSRITSNIALPASLGGGGGMYFPTTTNTSRILLEKVEISDNTCGAGGGGGAWIEGGSPSFESCQFVNNSSTEEGGAIRSIPTGLKSKMNATLFMGNRAATQGGAIYVSSTAAAPVVYTNCIFVRNQSGTEGGAIFNRAPAGGIVKFFYCTFYANTAGAGVGGIHYDGAASGMVHNSILWNNTPSDIPGNVTINYSLVKTPVIARANMLSEDPQFEAPDADPPVLTLKATSPAIDKGDLASTSPDVDLKPPAIIFDYAGKTRFSDGNADGSELPDMGSFELVTGTVIKPKFVRGICRHPDADLTGARIDLGDPLYLLRHLFGGFYPEPGCTKSCDANDSGTMDVADATYLINYLFRGTAAPTLPFPDLGEDPTPDTLTCVKGKLD